MAAALSTLPLLIDLKLNIADQNQAIVILTSLPSLQMLNGKSTKNEEKDTPKTRQYIHSGKFKQKDKSPKIVGEPQTVERENLRKVQEDNSPFKE